MINIFIFVIKQFEICSINTMKFLNYMLFPRQLLIFVTPKYSIKVYMT